MKIKFIILAFAILIIISYGLVFLISTSDAEFLKGGNLTLSPYSFSINALIGNFTEVLVHDNVIAGGNVNSTDIMNASDFWTVEEHGTSVKLTEVGHSLLHIQDDSPVHQYNCTLSASGGTVTVRIFSVDYLGDDLDYVVDNKWYMLTDGSSATLTAGTWASPTMNWVFSDEDEIVEVQTGSTMPTGEKVIWCMLNLGNSSGSNFEVWDVNDNIVSNYEALKDSAFRDWYARIVWESGIVPTFTGEELSTTAGIVIFGIRQVDFGAKDTTSNTVFVWANDPDGAFSLHDDLDSINKYETGETIGNNKFFNIMVFGLTNDEHNDYYYITVQDKPDIDYIRISDAEVDKYRVTDYNFPSPFSLSGFRIARVILKHTGANDNTIQILSNGQNHMDLRNLFVITLGGVGSSAIGLDDVIDNNPITDKNISSTGNITAANINTTGNINVGGCVIYNCTGVPVTLGDCI